MAGELEHEKMNSDLNEMNGSLDEFSMHDSIKPQKSLLQLTQEREIQRLKEEIEQLDILLQRRKELLNKHYEQTLHEDKSPKTVEDYRDECEDIKKKIQLTTKLSGITVEEFDYKPLKTGDIIQYMMTGNCNNTRFKVEFDCMTSHGENEENLRIVKLDIYVPEDVQDELQKVLVRLSESQSIWGFFQLITSYSRWHKERIETFQHFAEKYPDLVTISEECFIPYMVVKNTKHTHSPAFCINWMFDIDQVYRAKPKLELGMKIPNFMVKQDKDHRLDQTAERFRDLVEELGIEHAIDIIVKLAGS